MVGMYSRGKLCHFLADSVNAGLERHVHEFRLGVHLETSEDGGIGLVLDGELFAFVLRVGFQGSKHLVLLG